MMTMPDQGHNNYPSCFVCGYKNCGAYSLFTRHGGQPGPYFPFLETHEVPLGAELPTVNGKVLSCYACFAFLSQQWESYEKEKVPLVKRIYWLKRVDDGPYTGVEMGMQSEYASQVFGLSSDNSVQNSTNTECNRKLLLSNSNQKCVSTIVQSNPQSYKHKKLTVAQQLALKPKVDNDKTCLSLAEDLQYEALDLSVHRNFKKRRHDGITSNRAKFLACSENGPLEVLDLSMPDKNAMTEVCYICGRHHAKGTLNDIYAKPLTNSSPYFPSLMEHPRPSRSRPMEPSGKVLGCKDCSSNLILLWRLYEDQKIPMQNRNYNFKSNIADNILVCFRCGKTTVAATMHFASYSKNQNCVQFSLLSSSNYSNKNEIQSGLEGQVRICENCCDTIKRNNDSLPAEFLSQNSTTETIQSSRADTYNSSKQSTYSENGKSLDCISCCLCCQNYSLNEMQTLSMIQDSKIPNSMFFSFLKFLPGIAQKMVTKDGRILACKFCYLHLSNQWDEYEKISIPTEHRHFTLRSFGSQIRSPRLTPGTCCSPIGDPPQDCSKISNLSCVNQDYAKEIEKEYLGKSLRALEIVPEANNSEIQLPTITNQRSLNICIKCYMCGMSSKPGETYALNNKTENAEPIFHFLMQHSTPHPESMVDSSTYLVCLFCFHSIILQLQEFETKGVDYHSRFYDTHNFTCYICTTKTYRNRLYILHLKEFPFLKEHARPQGGLVVNNGGAVVICKDCYVSLNNQYAEMDRWGVPVEKRQYNWIQRPAPSESLPGFSGNVNTINLKINSGSLLSQHCHLTDTSSSIQIPEDDQSQPDSGVHMVPKMSFCPPDSIMDSKASLDPIHEKSESVIDLKKEEIKKGEDAVKDS